MKRLMRMLAAGGMALGLTAGAGAQEKKLTCDEALIPRFNIPKMAHPPKIDGTIDPAEWREAAKVMGMVSTGGLEYKDRPVSFWLAWDEQHLYLAYRVDTLTGPTPHLRRAFREKYATSVVFDDAFEGGLFLHDRNKLEGEVSSYLKFTINSLGSGEYMKNYPSIGQVMFNWTPNFNIANRTYTDAAGKSWWEMEIAMDLKDVQMKQPHKAGDLVDIGLFADVKNPGWQWLDFPSASGHLEHYGFPRAVLTDHQPYVQVEEFSGLHDEKVNLKSVVYNPADKPIKVNARLLVQHAQKIKRQSGELVSPTNAFDEARALEIPASGAVRFDVAKEFPGLPSADKGKGFLQFTVTRDDAPQGPLPYSFACNFWGKDKRYVNPAEFKPYLATRIEFNPANGRLALAADALDAPIPAGAQAKGATYRVSQGDKTVAEGKLRYCVNQWYDDLVELGALKPGTYEVALGLVDASGKELANAKGGFEKKNEARDFATWWNNRIGDTETLLKPFEALKVQKGRESKTAIACTRRVYEFGSLGLPVQIHANGGDVLAAPARIVVKVGGKEYSVPTDQKVKITGKKDWRVDFECAPVSVGGVTFSSKGWMEQDGLVELALTYGPAGDGKGGPAAPRAGKAQGEESPRPEVAGHPETLPAVEIEELRIEWPVDDSLGLHMACMGQGGNYSARTIGAVPKGNGELWNTMKDIGSAGSGRRIGNFLGNLWVGSEYRGLFWCADSDFGWEPHERVPAHELRRVEGNNPPPSPLNPHPQPAAVLMVNNLIGSAEGKEAFKLTEPRTVRFGYNASPFRNLADGWRLNQRSAAGSFSGGKYKVNWDTQQDFFSVLSPPFGNPARWPEYYAYCKDMANKLTYGGMGWKLEESPGVSAYYSAFNRRVFYTCNQVALRGYSRKSIEDPNPYDTFMGDWMNGEGSETLSKTYRDYMIWLMDRQVKEGGCQHFYFDISFGEKLFKQLAAGFGYRLPDGSVQPEAGDTNLREWYKRVQAMMQENGLYPGGVSGHATHSFSLKMLPFTDALLDSEYPMTDAIDVYTSDAMIALDCPHTFGTSINHLQNFMNPTWPLMHDGNDMFDKPGFMRWGISRSDVQFVPYWRNQAVVKELTPGLIASMWTRPGSAMIAIMNYGPDAQEQARTTKLALDLKALGVPAGATGDRLRIRQLYNHQVEAQYMGHLKWAKELFKSNARLLPPIEPNLDAASGVIGGFDVNYHDVKFLAVDWEEKPVDEASWKDLAADARVRTNALTWGVNGAARLADAEMAKLIKPDNAALQVQAWKRTGADDGRGNSLLLRVTNTGDKPIEGRIALDLQGLAVNVRKVWAEFTSAVSLDGQPVENRETAGQKRYSGICLNAYAGELYYRLGKGQTRVFSVDRY